MKSLDIHVHIYLKINNKIVKNIDQMPTSQN